MVKKSQSDGQFNMDDVKPRFEPIEYEEELNFSLQTPEHVLKQQQQEIDTGKELPQPIKDANSQSIPDGSKQEYDSQAATTSSDTKSPDSPPEAEESEEHRVTVMVHRSSEKVVNVSTTGGAMDQVQIVPSKDSDLTKNSQGPGTVDSKIRSLSTSASPPCSSAPRKNSLVTVIKLGSSDQPDSVQLPATAAPTKDVPSEPSVLPNASSSVTFKIPSSTNNIPLLPPPPASNKIRVGNTQILRPTPASPIQKISAAANKSKSLPRGLPSDGSAFDEFSGSGSAMDLGFGSAVGPQSLNPFSFGAIEQDQSMGSDEMTTEEEEETAEELELEDATDEETKSNRQKKGKEEAEKGKFIPIILVQSSLMLVSKLSCISSVFFKKNLRSLKLC